MIILICGLSGSGKSYLARNLAKEFNLKAIYTSDIFKQIVDNKNLTYNSTKMNKGWYEKSDFDEKRKKLPLDKKLDTYLLDIVNKKDDIVLDSWTLPYLTTKGVRIWLDTSLCNRSKRVSLRDNISFNQAIRYIKKKDEFSKTHFKKLYGFDFGENFSVFDKIIKTDNKEIPEVLYEAKSFIKKFY